MVIIPRNQQLIADSGAGSSSKQNMGSNDGGGHSNSGYDREHSENTSSHTRRKSVRRPPSRSQLQFEVG